MRVGPLGPLGIIVQPRSATAWGQRPRVHSTMYCAVPLGSLPAGLGTHSRSDNAASPRPLSGLMCGIFFSLSSSGPVFPHVDTVTWLRSRGPDSFQIHTTRLDGLQQTVDPSGEPKSTSLHLTFISTVLALRGDRLQSQPLVDADSKSVLCWNGEAWKIAGEPVPGNDTEHIFNLFLESARTSAVKEDQESAHSHEPSDDSIGKLAKLISSISGPFSFVFYDGFNSKLYFSRDCLGRRSLLQGADEEGTLRICSVCDGASVSYEEVNTDGLHMIDLVHISRPDVHNPVITNGAVKTAPYCITTIPWASDDTSNPPSRCLVCSCD